MFTNESEMGTGALPYREHDGASDTFPKPAPSWKITLEPRNVFARLAKGNQEPAPCLWNYRLLSRSGGLL